MAKHITTGQTGEDLACEYLVGKKYKILERNYRRPYGEIDIVVKAFDQALVFVEVKTLTGLDDSRVGLVAEDHLNQAKLIKFRRICEAYVAAKPELINEKKGWRMDLIAVAVNPQSEEKPKLRHYENIG